MNMKIYIAGPFSQPREREALKHMIEIVRTKYPNAKLYIPMEFKVPGDFQKPDGTWNFSNYQWAKAVRDKDVQELDSCDMVIAMYGSHYCTSGTVWEIGYAHGINKPITLYFPEYCKDGDNMSLMVVLSASHYMGEDGVFYPLNPEYLKRFNLK